MKPTLFEVVIKAENQGEGEDLSQKENLQKMNVPSVQAHGTHQSLYLEMLSFEKGSNNVWT